MNLGGFGVGFGSDFGDFLEIFLMHMKLLASEIRKIFSYKKQQSITPDYVPLHHSKTVGLENLVEII